MNDYALTCQNCRHVHRVGVPYCERCGDNMAKFDFETTCTPAVAAVKPLKPKLTELDLAARIARRIFEAGDGSRGFCETSLARCIRCTEELQILQNNAESWRCDSEQLARMVDKINAAMPNIKSIMGSECDHAEIALTELIERMAKLEAVAAAAKFFLAECRMCHGRGIMAFTDGSESVCTKCQPVRDALAALINHQK